MIKFSCFLREFELKIVNVEEDKLVGFIVFIYLGFDGDGDCIRFVLFDNMVLFLILIVGFGDVDVVLFVLDFERKI